MSCERYGNAVICRPNGWERIVERPDGEPRWCFRCRTQRAFIFVVEREIAPSYYGPNPGIKCSHCGLDDGDLFPGRFREWEG